jgi:hypothetical protein
MADSKQGADGEHAPQAGEGMVLIPCPARLNKREALSLHHQSPCVMSRHAALAQPWRMESRIKKRTVSEPGPRKAARRAMRNSPPQLFVRPYPCRQSQRRSPARSGLFGWDGGDVREMVLTFGPQAQAFA